MKGLRQIGIAVLAIPMIAQQPKASDVAAVLGTTAKSRGGKLEPGLEAIARAWRVRGIAGAERESAAQNVKLERLRFAGIIRLKDETRRPEVERALRRAWGEVTTAEENRIYARIPVYALRRISQMAAVEAIEPDRPMHPEDGQGKERLR